MPATPDEWMNLFFADSESSLGMGTGSRMEICLGPWREKEGKMTGIENLFLALYQSLKSYTSKDHGWLVKGMGHPSMETTASSPIILQKWRKRGDQHVERDVRILDDAEIFSTLSKVKYIIIIN